MIDSIGVVLITDRRKSKELKINYKTVTREQIKRVLLLNVGSQINIKKAAEEMDDENIKLIILHEDYITISMMKAYENTAKESRYDNIDAYYAILDATSEFVLSDNYIYKHGWDKEIECIDALKTNKISKGSIGVFECELGRQYNKKDMMQINEITPGELKERLERENYIVSTTVLIMLSKIESIKKVMFWDDPGVIGVVHKNGSNYAMELSSRFYNSIKKQIINK